MPAQKGIAEQLVLGDDTKLKWKIAVQHRNIHGGEVIDRIEVRFGGVNPVHAADLYWRQRSSQNKPRPQAREPMLGLSAAAEKGCGQRERTQNSGVNENERDP